jgi:hypothetical protein
LTRISLRDSPNSSPIYFEALTATKVPTMAPPSDRADAARLMSRGPARSRRRSGGRWLMREGPRSAATRAASKLPTARAVSRAWSVRSCAAGVVRAGVACTFPCALIADGAALLAVAIEQNAELSDDLF